MRFELIEAEKGNYPKALMCRALGVSRSGHHAFRTRRPSQREVEEQQLELLVAALFAELGRPLRSAAHRAGAPPARAAHEQKARRGGHGTTGPSCSCTAAVAAHDRLVARGAHRPQPPRPQLHGAGPDRVWVADTTYLPVLGGFLFLVVILDLFSRKVVGWSIGDRLDAELSGDALRSAIGRRQPRPGLIFHTDRGSEFAAQSFRKLLAQIGAVQSMSRKGNCWDIAESFFSTLEFEGPSTTTWRTSEAGPDLFAFIESYYNPRRLHSRNRYRSPNETESDWRSQSPAA